MDHPVMMRCLEESERAEMREPGVETLLLILSCCLHCKTEMILWGWSWSDLMPWRAGSWCPDLTQTPDPDPELPADLAAGYQRMEEPWVRWCDPGDD